MLRFIDLFSGIGGFHLGLSRSNYGGISECVFASELDRGLRDMYYENYGLECSGDIYDVDIDCDIPDFDLLMGGFPCQSFSISGKKLGFNDERGMLIYKIVEILERKLPKYFILENVKNILHIDGGSCYSEIMSLLGNSYSVKSIIANPIDIGLPYNRERVFFLGVRKDLGIDISSFDYVPRVTDKRSVDIESILEYGVDDIPMVDVSYRTMLFVDELIRGIGGIGHSVYLHPYSGKYNYPSFVSDKVIKKSEELISENKDVIDNILIQYDGLLDNKKSNSIEYRYGGGIISSLRDCIIQTRLSGIRLSRRDYFPTLVRKSSEIPIIWDKVLCRYRHLNRGELIRLHGLDGLSVYPKTKSKLCGAIGNSVCVPLVSEVVNQFLGYVERKGTESV